MYQVSIPGAIHDAGERYPPPKCHPRTRIDILQDITGWIGDDNRRAKTLWLRGPAGAGKSAIAQTISEQCQDSGTLAASFFFSRTSSGRDNAHHLVTTLAYQIALSFPEARHLIEEVITSDPSILSKSFNLQISKLIIEPLLRSRIPSHSPSKLIVIDGLDECRDEFMQREIIKFVPLLVSRTGRLLCALIASRPEAHISESFKLPDVQSLTRSISLEGSFAADEDLRVFLCDGFAKIHQNHTIMRSVPRSWPGQSAIDTLVRRSSGQFIYASTILKFVGDQSFRPTSRLDMVLGLGSGSIRTRLFLGIDQLYVEIFSSISDIATTLDVLGIYLALPDPEKPADPVPMRRSPNNRDKLDEVESILDLEPGDVNLSLRGLQSLLRIHNHATGESGATTNERSIQFFHASCTDFLLDFHRSGPCFIDLKKSHAKIASYWMDIPAMYIHSIPQLGFHITRSLADDDLLEKLLQTDLNRMADKASRNDSVDLAENILRWLISLVS